MRLLSCHIENFGKIKNQDYDFSSGITSIYKENGAGKSTLASFIKAMFYGLEGYKINSTEFCDRQHYYPFDGGNFGGNITFEYNSSTYKIERFFGEKSQTQDALTVYKNGDLTTEFGDDVGKAVFGIDKQSFERTAFISGEEIEIKSTSSINSKLSNFLQGGGDLDVDEAVLSLEKLAKEYKKSNKGRDKISEVTEEIAKLNENIANAEAIASSLDSKYSELNAIKAEIDELSLNSIKAQKESQSLTEWEHYEHLLKQIDDNEKTIKSIEDKYSGNIPSAVEVQVVSEKIATLRELGAKTENGLSPDESARLYRLEKAFSVGVPTAEDMLGVQDKIENISILKAKQILDGSDGLSPNDEGVYKTFSQNPPSAEKVQVLNQNVESYQFFKTEYDSMPDYLSSSKKGSPLKYGVIAIISLLCLIVGIITISSGVGIALTVIGGLALMLSGFLYLSDKATKSTVENVNKRKVEKDIREVEDKIKAVLIPYGYSSGNGVLYDYAVFSSDYGRYLEISKTLQQKQKDVQVITSKTELLKGEVSSFFAKYGLTGDNYVSNLTRLQSGVDELYSLKKRAESVTTESGKLKKEIEKIKGEINEFSQKHNLTTLNSTEILTDVNNYQTAKRTLEKLKQSASSYKQEKQLDSKPITSSLSLDDINLNLHDRQRKYSLLKHQIVEDEYAVDRLDGYYIDKNTAEEKLSSYKLTHKLLTETCNFLRLAEQNLKDKYVKPVKDEFIKYANLIEGVLGEKVTMTKNFELRFERGGKERLEKHLSSGIKSICAFCFRIAMLKNMYKDAMPFLVLDDPFVTLDEQHFAKVKKVLSELSTDMQIIYFTCHSSRVI